MKKIVIACDSFKGSLSSEQIAVAAERGIRRVLPDCDVRSVVVADGGEGTTEALMRSLGGRWVSTLVFDPLMRPIRAQYGITQDSQTAIIEMAAASGLPLLTLAERDPMKANTFGTGQLIAHAYAQGCRRFLVGIGGSATNDAGIGMLRALSFRFLDRQGRELEGGGGILSQIAAIDDSQVTLRLNECTFIVACDVNNPLVGPCGAAHVFAPQKGATPEMVEALDCGLRRFAQVVHAFNGAQIAQLPGAGAAGGLGGSMKALLGAVLQPGIEVVLEAIGFDALMKDCDLVITGEGRIDHQTAQGKTPMGVLKIATRYGVPVVAIAGMVDMPDDANDRQPFAGIFPIQSGPITLAQAMQPDTAEKNIERTVFQLTHFMHKISR